MGYPTSDHIKKFLIGKTIVDILEERNDDGDLEAVRLYVNNAEYVKLTLYVKPIIKHKKELIVVPFDAMDKVIQSTTILKQESNNEILM